jgi:hypothetical protein
MSKQFYFLIALILFSNETIKSQVKNLNYNIEALGGYTSPGHLPFWLRSNQYGSIPLDNASLSLIGSIHKDYDDNKNRIIDWGFSVEGRANIGDKSNFTIIEGYGKLRISIFEIRAGRSKEIMGLCDTILSSGSFAVSGNALGIPKVQISIPEFYSLPFFGKLFAFKGNFAHGWIGETSFRNLEGNVIDIETYLHQKSLYGRFGKPEWKLKLYGGINQQVFWGNEKSIYGNDYTLSVFQTYLYVITGKPYGTNSIPSSKIGNQLGSIDLGFEYEFRNIRLLAYRQNIYDVGALYYMANIRDGLNGLSLVNLNYTNKSIQWRKILVEVFYSKSQGGESWSKPRPSGAEDYYNNWQYMNGWSYKGIGIGNPFINPRDYTLEELPSDQNQYFINNRVFAVNFGYEGSVKEWGFILKTSYSLNYGTYRTISQFPETKQFSAYLEANRELKNGLNIGFIGAFDVGELYYDAYGVLLRVAKAF